MSQIIFHPSYLRLTLLRGDFGYWWKVKETLEERERKEESQLRFYESDGIGVYD